MHDQSCNQPFCILVYSILIFFTSISQHTNAKQPTIYILSIFLKTLRYNRSMSLQYCGILPYLSSFWLPRIFYYSQHGTSSSSLQRCGAHTPPCFSFRSLCCTLPSVSSTQPPLLRFIILCKFIGMCTKTIWTEGQITSTLWAKCILATWYSKSNLLQFIVSPLGFDFTKTPPFVLTTLFVPPPNCFGPVF